MKKLVMSLGACLALGSALGSSCIVSGSTDRPHPQGAYAAIPSFDGTGCFASYGSACCLDSVAVSLMFTPEFILMKPGLMFVIY